MLPSLAADAHHINDTTAETAMASDRDIPRRVESKRSPAWRQVGEEPDYRFTLANERTFLAWIRTALALLAAGVLLDQFSTKLQPHFAVIGVAVAMCVLSAVLCWIAYQRWAVNEQAMRHKRALPHSNALGGLALIVCIASGVLASLIVAFTRWG
jgi:putative membrane protein